MLRSIGAHLRGHLVAYVALFVALSGTAGAAGTIVPLAKRALVADNAKRLGGLTLKQLPPGKPGPQGSPGAVVAARANGSSSVKAGPGTVDYPLSSNTWTQAANETDLLYGEVTFDVPANCSADAAMPPVLSGQLLLNGKVLTGIFAGAANATNGVTANVGSSYVLDPGTDTARTLTAKISDNCQPGTAITVTKLRVNVVAVH